MRDYDPPAGALSSAVVVLLNGPPRSGKDTAGKYLSSVIGSSVVEKFAGSLKLSTHVDYGLPLNLPIDAFEDCKDEPNPAFFGETPRRAYIIKSEDRTKPFLGIHHFGKVMLRSMWRHYQAGKRVFFITDSGFAPEAEPVIEAVGVHHCMLIRIHAEDRGCSFKNDSRSYIELPSITSVDVANNGTIPEFHSQLLRIVHPFVINCEVAQPIYAGEDGGVYFLEP